MRMAFSAKLSLALSILPESTRWSRALTASTMSATSTGSSSGFGGSPIGPLEKSHVVGGGLQVAMRPASALALSNQ